jgi:hypothetical protein
MQRATLEILDGLSKLNGSLDAEMRRLIRVHFPTHLPAFDPKRNESDREELEGHLLHAGEKIRGESHRLEMIRKRQPERYLECLTELDETLREEIRYLGEVAGMVEEATRIAESYQLLQLIWEYDEILRRFDKHEAMLSQN